MYWLMGDAEQIIVFPYWCEDELKRFQQIGNNWSQLTQTDLKLRFIFVGRWDCKHIGVKQYSSVFEKYGSVSCLVLSNPTYLHQNSTRHDFAKHMFVKTMKYINQLEQSEDGGFVFWMEADVMLLNKDWLTKLYELWITKDRTLLLGHLVSYENDPDEEKRNFPSHINGVACYAKNLIKFMPESAFISTYRSFDVAVYAHLIKCGMSDSIISSDYWDHRLDFNCQPHDITKLPTGNKRILHGCKTEESFNMFIEHILTKEGI